MFGDPRISAQIAHMEEHAPRSAVYGEIRRAMHPLIQDKLKELELSRLFSHQAKAYDAAMEGRDVVVVTGTNSGKTMCYNLPALQMCLSEPAVRCLYLFPTKALAQDQLGKLEALIPGPQVRVGTYDGDTPQNQRSSIRKLSHIVLTNPDMLHVGIMPGHDYWAKFFKSLRLIVLDEMHVYRGVFGSNVGNVLRRLLRLCEWHKSRPQIIACSATIGNPTDLFDKLTGRKATLIDEDGSPSGKRTFVFWNPPELGEGRRLSANVATSEILASLTENGLRTLAFSRARVSAELVLRYTRKRVQEGGHVAPGSIESYRAGYTAKERRQIEQSLFRGDLLGLSATNAMELGVDVGGLDAVVMNGYPGTASSFWQQAGRAGRGARDGLAVFVAHDDPLEQFLVREPQTLLGARNESVGANPGNPQILSQHLLCAAHERPIAPSELTRFGTEALNVAEGLDRSGELEFRAGLFFYPSFEPPALRVNIRGAGGEQVRLIVDGQELGTMERSRAMTSAHEGAIYMHRGATFLVTSLDLENERAEVVPFEADYYTQTIVQSVLDPRVEVRSAQLPHANASLAGVTVTDMVVGFRKKSLDGDTVLGVEALDLPPMTYDTVCVRIDLPPLDENLDMSEQLGGIHGLEHALMAVAPLLAGCDRGDLGSAWYSMFPDTMRPAVFVFDKTPGGVGLCERLFESVTAWLRAAHQLLASCKCDAGCPGCLYSPRCEVSNEALSKPGSLALLGKLSQ
ncbi:DEAD/DEAH box helicase-like protein [Fimbriimonas ginsengisoli Gsoil 348]|uniref:DEAD/DEAH box helicase-like protein n=2 Tax=Fimbriimonas ginsengisoli TaxID=1005039 RepID=A0A068NUQ1_FIMGI|nr:DEAD/DEAH box helicase-like protein [Fimbriimonas ginsengisoli Gsoil 348]